MATIEDLTRCVAVPGATDSLLAIAWLGRDSEFVRGKVDDAFFDKLAQLCADPWQPFQCAGSQHCELCQFNGPSSSANVYIPGNNFIYIAPVAIVHYIAAHWYLPPMGFIEATMACPPMRGIDYLRALLANGGRALVAGREQP